MIGQYKPIAGPGRAGARSWVEASKHWLPSASRWPVLLPGGRPTVCWCEVGLRGPEPSVAGPALNHTSWHTTSHTGHFFERQGWHVPVPPPWWRAIPVLPRWPSRVGPCPVGGVTASVIGTTGANSAVDRQCAHSHKEPGKGTSKAPSCHPWVGPVLAQTSTAVWRRSP